MSRNPAQLGYRMPAEWEEHDATWLSWPKDPNTFPPDLLPLVEKAYVKMVTTLSAGEEVRILVDDEKMERRVGDLLGRADRVVFHRLRTVDVWVRDYAPTYLKGKRAAIVKWRFNAWGNKYEDLLADDESGERIALSTGLQVFRPGLILEGGSIDVDGKGTIITTEQCLLNPNRNPGIKRSDIEEALGRYLAARKVIWLRSGIEGDDTDGHVDDVARFTAPGRVVVATEARRDDPNRATLAAAQSALQASVDADGTRLEATGIPMPPYQSSFEGRLPASHLNFYIGNESVLLPAFGGRSDKEAKATLQEALPHREVVSIDCRALVHGLGTIHCVTQQVPRTDQISRSRRISQPLP